MSVVGAGDRCHCAWLVWRRSLWLRVRRLAIVGQAHGCSCPSFWLLYILINSPIQIETIMWSIWHRQRGIKGKATSFFVVALNDLSCRFATSKCGSPLPGLHMQHCWNPALLGLNRHLYWYPEAVIQFLSLAPPPPPASHKQRMGKVRRILNLSYWITLLTQQIPAVATSWCCLFSGVLLEIFIYLFSTKRFTRQFTETIK